MRDERAAPHPRAGVVIGFACLTTAIVTGLSYFLPARWSATGIGFAFLGATYVLALQGDTISIRHFGLSLGGLVEPAAIEWRRFFRDLCVALGWGIGIALIAFPPFWLGWRIYWHATSTFHFRGATSMGDEALGQLVVVALPEEAFYRGYLMTALDDAWGRRWRLFGAELGFGWIVSAALFAVGHLLTEPRVDRLAVFFPALLFGWMRARTGGIGAGIVLHALSNVFSATLARGYGLMR